MQDYATAGMRAKHGVRIPNSIVRERPIAYRSNFTFMPRKSVGSTV